MVGVSESCPAVGRLALVAPPVRLLLPEPRLEADLRASWGRYMRVLGVAVMRS